MTDHPLTETAAAVLWNAHRTPNTLPFHEQGRLYVRDQTAMLRAAFDAGREYERANPKGDRPWEPLNGRRPRVDDEVRQEYNGVTRIAVVDRVDKDGDLWTAEGRFIGFLGAGTWHVRRAPTPPAEEVELPTEHPAHLTDVEHTGGIVCAYMALDNDGDWCGVSTTGLFCDWSPHELAAFTLPDGTRARRDGKHENGTPRFVKVEADQ